MRHSRGPDYSSDQKEDGPRATGRALRCAVYTRKSSEEGLDQAFNSLDAQREAGADYIRSQRHQGWSQVNTSYDDGGFSGGSMQRPALLRLLNDIEAGRIDVVVVYKVDRLSRSLADFARLMQVFDEHGVSFVSVTQQFNTTTSMGRLTLNMLLSFAQFEREVAGERIRDKIAATKRKGVWVTGQPPLGYRVLRKGEAGSTTGRALQIVDAEAGLVRAIFAGYLRHGSPLAVAQELNAAGHRTRCWTSARGVTHGGRPLTAQLVHRVLTNPVYIGKITHKRPNAQMGGRGATTGRALEVLTYDGLHQPIIDPSTWAAVQDRMQKLHRAARERDTWSHTHLLKGKLFTAAGSIMSPSSVQRPVTTRRDHPASGQKKVIRYYVSQQAIKHGYASCPIKSVNAQHLDSFVRDAVSVQIQRRTNVNVSALNAEARDDAIRGVVGRVTVGIDTLTIVLDRTKVGALNRAAGTTSLTDGAGYAWSGGNPPTLQPTITEGESTIALTFAIDIKRFDARRFMLSHNGSHALNRTVPTTRVHPTEHIRLALGLAFAWRDALLRRDMTITDLAREHGLAAARVHLLLTLTQLGPTGIRHVLDGTLRPGVSLGDISHAAADLGWQRQEDPANCLFA